MAFCAFCGNDAGASRFCTRCGAPLGALPPRPPSRKGRYARGDSLSPEMRKGLAAVAVVIALIVGMGVVADAVEAGRRVREERRAALVRFSRAQPTLRDLHVLQQLHRMEHGRYAARLEDLGVARVAGWNDPESPFFRFAVSTATRETLCLEARLTAEGHAAGLTESSMDERGRHRLGPGCTGPAVGRTTVRE